MKIKPTEQDKAMERAIVMLVKSVEKNCRNPKPLILHSLRVGLRLAELKQPKEVVIAGFLHDLVEDTSCTIEDIRKNFGIKTAKLVEAMTHEKIEDDKKRWHVLMQKIKKAGRPAMLLKVVDIYENLPYIALIKNKKYLRAIQWKHNFAMGQMKPCIGCLKIFQQCAKAHQVLFKKLK